MLATVLVILHVSVSLFLIFVVLLQSGQAADLAGAFGGGGSQTALGMRGAATLLQKVTTAAAVTFMLTSLALGIVGRQETSLIEGLEPGQQSTTPIEVPQQDSGPPAGQDVSGEGQGGAQDDPAQQQQQRPGQQGSGTDPGSRQQR